MVTWHQIGNDDLNPFNVVRTSTDGYNASSGDFVITDQPTVNLPTPSAEAFVAVRGDTQYRTFDVKTPSGKIYKFDPKVYYTGDNPASVGATGVSAGSNISVSTPTNDRITELYNGARYDGPKVLLFISDGVDWYISNVSNISSVVPDSEANQKLLHRWVLNDVDSGTVTDSEGGADGTVKNGLASVSGDYAGGGAGDGDGNDDYAETTTWGSFGSNIDSDFALAFTIETSTGSGIRPLATQNSNGTGLFTGIGTGPAASGELEFAVADESTSFLTVTSASTVADGAKYRVVLNKTSNSASGLDVWLNQTEDSTTVENDQSFSSPADFNNPVPLFARNNEGSLQDYFAGVLDDICVFGDSLTQSEIESYQNPWQ